MPRTRSKKNPAPQGPADKLAQISIQIKALEKITVNTIAEIGGLLERASELCKHGEYMAWLKAEFGWSHTTALRYRDVYAMSQSPQFGEFGLDLGELNISISALYMVARLLRDKTVEGHGSPEVRATGVAIIEAAKKSRVTWQMAATMLRDDIEKTEAAAIEADEADDSIDVLADEAPDSLFDPAKTRTMPVEITHRTVRFNNGKIVSDDGGDEVPTHPSYSAIWLAEAFKHVVQFADTRPEMLSEIIDLVGPENFRQTIAMMQAALDDYAKDEDVSRPLERELT
jgi:Protein of unknown function (DUF3102)